MTQRLILVLSVLAIGALGFELGSRWGVEAASPIPGVTSSNEAVDWARVSDRDLTSAMVFLAARDRGLPAAVDTLRALATRDAAVQRGSHAIAHALGRYAVARNGNDPSLLTDCPPLFKAGCQHGVLEGYLAAVPSVEPPRLVALCLALSGPDRPVIDVRECAHGLGHGLLDRLAYDVPGALRACDAFEGPSLREECHDGVFMQNVVRGEGLPGSSGEVISEHAHGGGGGDEHAGHGGAGQLATFLPSDVAYPCNQLAAAYQGSCWSYQPLAVSRILGDRGARALAACELAPPDARARCYAGYGKQAFTWFGRSEADVIEMCDTLSGVAVDVCLAGVVEWYVDDEWGADTALAFCERLHLGGRNALGCYESLGARIALLQADAPAHARECNRAALPHYVEACLRGAARS